MYAQIDDISDEPVRATVSQGHIRLVWGSATVTVTVAEAVDLIDAVATVLVQLDGDARLATSEAESL